MDTYSALSKLLEFSELGVIGRTRRAICFTDEPKFSQWFCEPSLNRIDLREEQYGSSLSLDDDTAKIKSIAEAIERYCSETIDKNKLVSGTFNSLEKALDPALFVNFDNKQLFNKKGEYIDNLRSSKLMWVEAINRRNYDKVLIPAQLVYSPYNFSDESLIRIPVSTGAAFGPSEDFATSKGLLEIIERDAFMLMWLTKKCCSSIDLTSDKEINPIYNYFKRYLLDAHVIDISTDIGVPSMLGILIDRTGLGPAVSFGLKTDYEPKNAIIGSLLEAQHVRGWIRYSYLNDDMPSITSPSQIVDLKTRGYYWYPQSRIKDIEFLFKSRTLRKISEIPSFNETDIVSYIINRGFNVYTIDLSTNKVKERGFFVIKTISTEFHPLSLNEDMPYNYSNRLNIIFQGEINTMPHPFL